MKLLFDQNLSLHLVGALADLFSDSAHVRQLGFDTADDDAIWRYAEKFGFTIISKDTDFQ
jgi:predicted nuclease of predicted toxin-antitoxin system